MKLDPFGFFKNIYYYVLLKFTKYYHVDNPRLITLSISFEREDDGRWYAVLPEWKGSRSALLMVAGADEVLEMLSNGNKKITLNVSNDIKSYILWSRNHDVYHALSHGNGDYVIPKLNYKKIWLCSVNVFVWGGHPDNIYFYVKE